MRTTSTQDCLSSLHSHDYKSTPECTFSLWHAFLHDRPALARSPWELKGKVTLSHSHRGEWTNQSIQSQHPACHLLTATAYWTEVARLQPPSLHSHVLQAHLQTHMITASKLTRSRPPRASATLLDYGLYVWMVISSKCISKLTWLRSWSASLSLLDHSRHMYPQTRSITTSRCISKLTRSRIRSWSLSSLDPHFQVHFELLTTTVCSQSRYTVGGSVAI